MNLRNLVRGRRAQQGVAAVELALVLPVLIVFISFPLFFGRVFWHYTVAERAAHDAARYLATVPRQEMGNRQRGMDAAAIANFIAMEETAELNPGGEFGVSVDVLCDIGSCNLGVPPTVTVIVRMKMFDPLFSAFTWPVVGDDGLLLRAAVTMRYVGT